jgi:hypothetical protein
VITRSVIVVVFNYILLLGQVYWLMWQNSSAHESRNCCCIFISCCLLRYIYWLMWQNSSAHESRNCCCIIIYCCLLRYIGSCGRITVLTRAVIVVVFNYILLLGRVYWAYWLIWQNYSAQESCNCCCVIYYLVAWSGILAHVAEFQCSRES